MRWILFLFSILVLFTLYRPTLRSSFTQDDFFLLRQAHFNSFTQQLSAALPRFDSIYFRPLGMQGYFFVTDRLFGLNPWMYRIASIALLALNAVLIYGLVEKILPNIAGFTFILYLFSSMHFLEIGWLANISFLLGTFVELLAINMWIRKRYRVTMLLFIAGLLVNELVITLPVLLWILSRRFVDGDHIHRRFLKGFIGIGLAYMIFRIIAPHASSGSYEFGVGPHVLQNIRWLLLWTLGWPETVRDYFLTLWTIRSDFVHTFFWETISLVISSALFLYLIAHAIRTDKRNSIFLLWFLVSVAPVLLFTNHISPHYAAMGSVGIYILVGLGLSRMPRYFQFLTMGFWIVVSVMIFKLSLVTNWWVQHSTLSESLMRQVERLYPRLPVDKIIQLETPDPKRAEVVLSGDNALQLIYNDAAVKTVFVQSEK